MSIGILVRRLLRRPSFSIPVVLTLALAIGANIMIFTIVNGVLIRAMPYPDADRLVVLSSVNQKTGEVSGASRLDMEAWRDQSSLIDRMSGMYTVRYSAVAQSEPVVVETAFVNDSFFDLTGVAPILGRRFDRNDGKPGAPPVALISRAFWEQQFGGDKQVLGKAVRLDTKPYTVVGVLDANARFPLAVQKAEIWAPIVPSYEPRGVRGLTVIGHLKRGVALPAAQSELDAIAHRLSQTVPADIGYGISIAMLQDHLVGRVRAGLWFVQGAVGFLLLLACANIAHLTLVATLARMHEIGVMSALGATRLEIIRGWFGEGAVLGTLAALLGGGIAFAGVRLFMTSLPDALPRLSLVRADVTVIAFAVGVTFFSVVLFSLAPVALVLRSNAAHLLQRSSPTLAGLSTRWPRSILVVAQVALALVLSAGAATLVNSLLNIVRTRWGFEPKDVMAIDVQLPFTVYGFGEKPAAAFEKILENIRNIHGVQAAGMNMTVPFDGEGLTVVAVPKDRPEPPKGQEYRVRYRPISDGYFKAMEIPLMRGRDFSSHDRSDAPGVIIIDETLANHFWPGRNPIGQRIATRVRMTGKEPADWEVVGVVGAVKDTPDAAAPDSYIYVPYLQQGWPLMTFTVKTTRDRTSVTADVRQAIRTVDPGQGIQEINSMDDRISQSIALPKLYAILLSVFAAIALVLSCIGTYGAIAYSVSQRTAELGVRMALGAQRKDLLRMIIGESVILIAAGLILGSVTSILLGRSLASLSSEVHGIDRAMFVLMAVMVAITGLAACYIPARRASQLEPLAVLKYE